jgi:hypothetical protein
LLKEFSSGYTGRLSASRTTLSNITGCKSGHKSVQVGLWPGASNHARWRGTILGYGRTAPLCSPVGDEPALTLPLRPKLCANCGKPFQPTSGNQRLCSKGCGGQIGKYQAKPKADAATEKKPALGPTHLSSGQLDGAKQRARLYRELLSFIQQGKAWVTSEPGCSPMRFEAIDSQIADQLRSAGHRVTHLGQGERLTGFGGFQRTRDRILHYSGIVPVQIYEINLGGSYPPADSKLGQHFRPVGAALVSSC